MSESLQKSIVLYSVMMETEAEKIHGIRLVDSDLSDSSGSDTTDSESVYGELYNVYKPPPILIRNIIIANHPIISARNRNMFVPTNIEQQVVLDVSKSIPRTNMKELNQLSLNMISNRTKYQTIPTKPITDHRKQTTTAKYTRSSFDIDTKCSKIQKPKIEGSIGSHASSPLPQIEQSLHQKLSGHSLSKPLTKPQKKPLLPKTTRKTRSSVSTYAIEKSMVPVAIKENSFKTNGLLPNVPPELASSISQNTRQPRISAEFIDILKMQLYHIVLQILQEIIN